LIVENAFNFSFKDKSFDLSFSNGFWIYFKDDLKLQALLKESCRISRKYVVILVHNKENKLLVNKFMKKSKTDSLYAVRFFYRKELLDIIKESNINYESILLKKFGGPVDFLYTKKFLNMMNPINKYADSIVPKLYEHQPWGMRNNRGVKSRGELLSWSSHGRSSSP
jgi:ubiquinone/menaquinone biosynthesis C-methylase UbiE